MKQIPSDLSSETAESRRLSENWIFKITLKIHKQSTQKKEEKKE